MCRRHFLVFTLFAIAYEIQAAGIYTPDDIMDVQLVVGLPPAHYGTQYERFEKYFSKGNDIVDFEFRDKLYSIYISAVLSFPQAYAAAMPVYGRIKDFPKATIVDIGGFTADYDLLLEESDIDAILCGECTDFGDEVCRLIDSQAKAFIADLIGRLRERMIDLKNGRAIFVDEISANTRGYELMYKAAKAGR